MLLHILFAVKSNLAAVPEMSRTLPPLAPRGSRLACFFFRGPRLRRVVTFAVNRRYLGAHGTQVCGKLSAMVDGVVLRKRKETDRRHLEHAAKINRPGQLLTAQSFHLFDIGIEGFVKPLGNPG